MAESKQKVATVTDCGHLDVGKIDHPAGRKVLVRLDFPRSLPQHRMYWGLLRSVAEATGSWRTADDLHRWVKIELGHYNQHPQPDGTVLIELLPTNFGSMPSGDFSEWLHSAVAAIAMQTGIDPEELHGQAR